MFKKVQQTLGAQIDSTSFRKLRLRKCDFA